MLQSQREANGRRKRCYLWNGEARRFKINAHEMTYWKAPGLLLINASFWLQRRLREGNKEKENFCLIQGHLVASCKPPWDLSFYWTSCH